MVSPIIRLARGNLHQLRPTQTADNREYVNHQHHVTKAAVVSPMHSPPSNVSYDTPSSAGRQSFLDRRTPPPAYSAHRIPCSPSQSEVDALRSANKKKDSQLRVLHQRFTQIQQGLGSIDQERSSLVEKAKALDKEKRLIQKQLEIREKEILSLVKRCSSQEGKMKESSKLRGENRELLDVVDALQGQVDTMEQDKDELYTLRQRLQESELEREDLQDKLARVKRDHDSIAHTLQECLSNIRKLSEEKQHVEEERRRERKRAEIELERQRLEYVQSSNDLRDAVETKQFQIHQMEKIIQENMVSNTSLRREKAILAKEQDDAVKNLVESYESKLLQARGKAGESTDSLQKQHGSDIEKMRAKISEKEAAMMNLEGELSEQMQELMTKQSSLDESEESRRLLEANMLELRDLETAHSALVDYVAVVESNLGDLTNEHAKVALERDGLQEEVALHQERINGLQETLSGIYSKNESPADLSDGSPGSLSIAKGKIVSLEAELASRKKWILKLEEEMKGVRRLALIKEEEIQELQNQQHVNGMIAAGALNKVGGASSACPPRSETVTGDDGRQPQSEHIIQMDNEVREGVASSEDCRTDVVIKSMEKEISTLVQKCSSLEDEVNELRQNRALKKDSGSTPENKYVPAIAVFGSLEQKENELVSLREEVGVLKESKAALEIEVDMGKISTTKNQKVLEELKKENAEKDNSNSELLAKYAHTTKAVETLKTEIDELHQRQQCLTNELAVSRDLVSAQESSLKAIEAEVQQSERRRLITEDTLQIAEKKLTIQANEIENLKPLASKLQETENALKHEESKVMILEAEVVASSKTQSEREIYNREAHSNVVVLKAEVTAKTERLTHLEGNLKELGDTVVEKRRRIDELETQLMTGEEKRSTLLSQLTHKNDQIDTFSSLIEEKAQQILTLNEALRHTKGTLEDTQKVLKDTKLSLDQAGESQKRLNEQLLKTEEEAHCSKQELYGYKGKVDSLNEQLKEAHLQLDEKAKYMKEAELKVAEKALQYSELESKEAENVNTRGIVEQELNEAKEKIAIMETEISTMRYSSTTLKHDLEHADRNLKRELQTWADKESGWTASKKSLELELAQLEQQLSQRKEEIQGLRSDVSKREDEKVQLEQVVSESSKKHNDELAAQEAEMNQLDRDKGELMNRLEEAEEEIDLLENELTVRDSRITTLESELEDLSKNEVELAYVESEQKRHSLETNLEKTQKKLDELATDLGQRESKLLDVDMNLEASKLLVIEKDLAIKQAESKYAESEKEKCSLAAILEEREDHLLKTDQEMEAGKSRIQHLDSELSSLQNHLELTLNETQLTIVEKEAKINELIHTLSENKTGVKKYAADLEESNKKLDEESRKTRTYASLLDEQGDRVASLDAKLKDSSEMMETIEHRYKTELSESQCQIRKLQTSIALKDDEIRELRVVELQDAEDNITSLKSELHFVSNQMKSQEVAATKLIAEMRIENDEWQTKMETLDKLASMTQQQHQDQVQQMGSQLLDMERVVQETAQRALRAEEQSDIKDVDLDGMRKKCSTLEKKQEDLQDERERLHRSIDKKSEELKTSKRDGDALVKEAQHKLEKAIQEKESRHLEEVTDLKLRLESAEKAQKENEVIVNERSSLLGDMVEHNKDLERREEDLKRQVSQFERQIGHGKKHLLDLERELESTMVEAVDKEDALGTLLENEKKLRESTERSLAKLKLEYIEATKSKKTVAELEKQNTALKDKICRQEAYLQRKLQNDKKNRTGQTTTGGCPRSTVDSSSMITPEKTASSPWSSRKTRMTGAWT